VDSSSVRYRGGHVSYNIVHERTSRACTAHILQRHRLRLIIVTRHAHCPWLALPHVLCGRPYDAAHWEPGVGTWGRHQWWAKLCMQKGPLCSSYRVVSKSLWYQHCNACPVSTHSDINSSIKNSYWQWPEQKMTHKRLKSLYRCRRVPVNECSSVYTFVCTRLLLHTYTMVGWTSQCNMTPVAPAQVNPCHLLVLLVKTSVTRRILRQSSQRTVSVPLLFALWIATCRNPYLYGAFIFTDLQRLQNTSSHHASRRRKLYYVR